MPQKRLPIPDDVFRQICVEMAEAELAGDFEGMFARGSPAARKYIQSAPDQPNRKSFLSTFKVGMKLYRSAFLKIYGYELTWPGFAEDALTRLEILGCSNAREYYVTTVAAYRYEHEKEMINVAEWYRKELERSEKSRTRQQEAEQEKEVLHQMSDKKLLLLLRELEAEGAL